MTVRDQTAVLIDLREARNPDLGSMELSVKSVAVVGLGYVGLPTALGFIDGDCAVTGIDIDGGRLERIREGHVDLLDSDLRRLRGALRDQTLHLTTDPSMLTETDAVIVCVPTPVDEHLTPDVRALQEACRTVVRHARLGQTLILTSTSYVGTTRDMLIEPLTRRGMSVGEDIHVAFSPERIDPGNYRHPQRSVPRIVGGATPRCADKATELLLRSTMSVHAVSTPETAEMTKLLENTFRAVNIALVNEMADLSARLNLQITEVIEAAATKPYGFMPFHPGPGVGGHCIPCDPHYLLWQMRALRVEAPLVAQAMSLIAGRPGHVVRRARDALADRGLSIRGASVLVVGMSYKPDVQDLRESPAVLLLDDLLDSGADASFYDPLNPRLLSRKGTELRSTEEPQAQDYDLVILVTRHTCVDHSWLFSADNVLDATYTLTEAPARTLL